MRRAIGRRERHPWVQANKRAKTSETNPLLLLAVLLCALASLCLAASPTQAAAAGDGGDALVIGVPADRCPIFYKDADTGEATGIGVDLMRAAADEAGYEVEFAFVKERNLKEALDGDGYDAVMPFGSAVPSASGQGTVVSETLMEMPFTLVTRGKGDLPSFNELHVGMLSSLATGADTVKEMYPGIEITLYDTMDECVEALRAGKVDALLHNSYVWSYVLQKPAYSDLRPQPGSVFSMSFRVGAPDTAENRDMIERLNKGIATLTDSRRQATTLDYTSRKLYRYDIGDYFHEYGLVVILVALLVAALVAAGIMRSRAVRLEHEKALRELVDHDPLTGTLSLDGFKKRARELLQEHPETPYVLVYVNVKDFKYVNDNLGREAGDSLLRFLARMAGDVLGEHEAIGRVTADQFALLMRNEGAGKLKQDEERVLSPVRSFFIDRGGDHRVLVCAGIYVLVAQDYRRLDIDQMMDYAMTAAKRVREIRDEGYEFYNPEQWEKEKRASEVVNYLPSAIESGTLQVWYQPQVDYPTGEITGAEALCRLKHGRLGMLEPSDFIEALETVGIIYDLDRFVWERACQDLARWNAQGHRRSVSVNVSRCDIRKDRDIPGHFEELISAYDLSPDQLRIEITESAYAKEPESLIDATARLRELGFQVEMDDFGSGYSSLHMLKEVPVDRIKLDLDFLTEAGDADKSRIIVSCVIGMMDQLGTRIIAEGVESKEEADFLLEHGCCEMQGFYFYRPMPVEEFEKLLAGEAAQEETPAGE